LACGCPAGKQQLPCVNPSLQLPPTRHLPTSLGIHSPRCEQGAPLIPDARSTISISGETALETNGKGQRLQVRCSASVLSMIKLPSPLLLSPAGNITTTPTSCTDPHRAQAADRNQRYQDGEEPPFQRNLYCTHDCYVASIKFSLGYSTVHRGDDELVLPFSASALPRTNGRPTAGLSQG
jgi:hypothetical protein